MKIREYFTDRYFAFMKCILLNEPIIIWYRGICFSTVPITNYSNSKHQSVPFHHSINLKTAHVQYTITSIGWHLFKYKNNRFFFLRSPIHSVLISNKIIKAVKNLLCHVLLIGKNKMQSKLPAFNRFWQLLTAIWWLLLLFVIYTLNAMCMCVITVH